MAQSTIGDVNSRAKKSPPLSVQLHDEVVKAENVTDEQKARICERVAEADKVCFSNVPSINPPSVSHSCLPSSLMNPLFSVSSPLLPSLLTVSPVLCICLLLYLSCLYVSPCLLLCAPFCRHKRHLTSSCGQSFLLFLSDGTESPAVRSFRGRLQLKMVKNLLLFSRVVVLSGPVVHLWSCKEHVTTC